MEWARQQRRRRLCIDVGRGCMFPNCGETDPLRLTGSSDDLVCYEHRRIQQGATPVEDQHPATKRIDPTFTVPMLGNDHRVVTVMSRSWIDGVKSVQSSSMQKHLARLFALRDNERQLVEQYGRAAEELLAFFRWLEEKYPGVVQEFEQWRDSNERG
jgi:hypothetical protein